MRGGYTPHFMDGEIETQGIQPIGNSGPALILGLNAASVSPHPGMLTEVGQCC